MSIIAKVFSIVVLILSVVFVSMSVSLYGESVYWKPKFYTEKAQNIELKEDHIRKVSYWTALAGYYENQKNATSVELKKQNERVAQLENEMREREMALAVEYQKNFRVVAQLMETVREISRMNRVLKQRQDVIMKQQQALMVARQNSAVMAQQVSDLQRQNNQMVQYSSELTRHVTKLEQDLEEARRILDIIRGLGVIDFGALEIQRPINGKITSVRPETASVVIDRGEQHKVQIGNTFWVYRGDKLIGRVRVTSVQQTACAATIMPEFTQGVFQVNDNAATVLER